MQERVGHGYPCGGGFTKLAMSTQAYAYLQRCETCGALWDRGERSNHRVLASRAATFYPDVVVEPFVLPRPAPASTPLRYWAHLNQGAVFRLYAEVERGGTTEIWAVVSGAVLERCDELDEGPLVECSANRFDQLLATFGAVKASALRLAFAGGLHPVSLKALDLARQFGTEPPAGTSTSPDELAKEVLRPLVRSGAISPHDLVVEGFPLYSTR